MIDGPDRIVEIRLYEVVNVIGAEGVVFGRDPLCPVRRKECSKCSQEGHSANVCKTKVKEIPSRSRIQ